jgi:hypothetical protein
MIVNSNIRDDIQADDIQADDIQADDIHAYDTQADDNQKPDAQTVDAARNQAGYNESGLPAKARDLSNPLFTPQQKDTEINISFAGDCTLGTDTSFGYSNSFPYRLSLVKNDYSYFLSNVKSVFENDDLTLVNLETTLTTANKPATKKFRFKGDPSYVKILNEGSIEAVNIANNHIHDYLDKGFDDTVEALDKAGISYSGWENTAYIAVKDVKIALIGYTAWDDRLRERLSKSIDVARKNAQIVIVSMHWGKERVNLADESQKALAHFCIDKGANAVIGHHPHVIQGVEQYKSGYIAYSLGNFCFGGNSNPSDKDSIILRLNFKVDRDVQDMDKEETINARRNIVNTKGDVVNTRRNIVNTKGDVKIKAEIIPCSISSVKNINDYHPTILEGDDKERVLKRIAQYSK